MTDFIGQTFPEDWLWSRYENQYIESIRSQIDHKFAKQKNLLINLTWFGPQFGHNGNAYAKFLEYTSKVDNLFLLCSVDPSMLQTSQIEEIVSRLDNPRLYKLGNFDGKYQFNFFAPVLAKHFREYDNAEIVLRDPKWHFINYNRKPRQHRVDLVKKMIAGGLDKHGLITLGKTNSESDKDLYLTLGEKDKDYVQYGHWFTEADRDDDIGIPHDVLSLHNIKYWQRHFLHIIGATEFSPDANLFVSETQFKPIIGLRPFLINGNPKTYEWLERQGFKTFNKYFPGIDFMDTGRVHESILGALMQIKDMTQDKLQKMYDSMMPELSHNQKRFFKFAEEQRHKIDNLF